MATFHCTIRGRVQGVGFRRFVEREARALGVTGWVRNRPDGSVEALAEGTPASLEALLASLRDGPLRAEVADVDLEWREDAPRHRTFRIE